MSKSNTQKSTPAAKPETEASKAAAAAKAEQAAQAAEAKVATGGKAKKVKKHLIENTTEHRKDINYVTDDGSVKTVTVPAAKFANEEGTEKKVNGWVVVDVGDIEIMQTNAVIKHYFESGELIDSGETDAEVEVSSEDE